MTEKTMFHKKRNSCSNYSNFMNNYKPKNTEKLPRRNNKLLMSVQNLTLQDEIEEEDEEAIPEEGNSPGDDTACANINKYNSKLLSNNTRFRNTLQNNNLLQKERPSMSSTMGSIPLSQKLK